ncbi:tetratricopeptide repeat protein [Nocardia sp. NPDC004722]
MSEKIEKARILADLGRYDGAREMLAEVLASEPENAAALADMANVAYRMGEYGRALEFSGAALRVTPDDVFVWRVRALSELQLARAGNGEAAGELRVKAIAAARRAVELDPDNVDNVRILAATQRDTDPAAALANLDKALELDPDNVHVHSLRGLTLRRNIKGPDAMSQAEAAFREVLRLDPENSEALYELALITVDRGERQQGATQLRRVAELDPTYAPAVRDQLARMAKQDELQARRTAGDPYVDRPTPAPVPAPSSGRSSGGRRFGRIAAAFVALILIRGVAAAFSHDSSTPSQHNYYSPPPTFPSYLQHFTIPPMPPIPTWPSNFPTYRIPAPPTPR